MSPVSWVSDVLRTATFLRKWLRRFALVMQSFSFFFTIAVAAQANRARMCDFTYLTARFFA